MKVAKNSSRFLISLAPGIGFAYVLSLLFEGPVMYGLCAHFSFNPSSLIMAGIIGQLAGLFLCGFFVRTVNAAKKCLLCTFLICIPFSIVFFFTPSALWYVSFVSCNFLTGLGLAAWSCFLKIFVPRKERIKAAADLLIISNILMICFQVITANVSPFIGLGLAIAMLPVGFLITLKFPKAEDSQFAGEESGGTGRNIVKPILILFAFITVITINSGLMYQVLNPAFSHLTWLSSWYWAIPYVVALVIMRNLPLMARRSTFLYIAMGMMMASFLFFLLLDRSAGSYLVVNTLMLGACGIFDLFWWSILAETLDYAKNPVKVFGIGLSANVLGIIIGSYISRGITTLAMPEVYTTVIALTIVCITLVILPPLNRWLVLTLKNHTYLNAYALIPAQQQDTIIHQVKPLEKLTEREDDVLKSVLNGKSNREIASELFISENTVKTHLRNIYQKYDVSGRAELISTLLHGQVQK